MIAEATRNGAGGSGGGGSGVVIGSHGLNSGYHTGTLGDNQAPQFLKTDGSRDLVGDLEVAEGVTIDSVDISAHALDPNAHHNLATSGNAGIGVVGQAISLILAGTSGLNLSGGLNINDSIAGNGLGIASKTLYVGAGDGIVVGAGDVAIKRQTDSGLALDVTGVAVNEGLGLEIVTNALKVKIPTHSGLVLDSAGVYMGDPTTLSVHTDNSVSGSTHVHAVATDSDVGSVPARAILSSTDEGYLDLAGLGLWGNLDFRGSNRWITGTGNVHLRPNTNLILDPIEGVVELPNNQVMRTTQFDDLVTGITGYQFIEQEESFSRLTIGGIKADELYVRVFVADETRINRGSEYWSKSFGIVQEDFALPDDQNTVDVWVEDAVGLNGADVFTVGDLLLMRIVDRGTGLVVQRIWFEVVAKLDDDDTVGAERQQWRIRRRNGGLSETLLDGDGLVLLDSSSNVLSAANFIIKAGSTLLDAGQLGQGWIHLSALKEDDGPFIQMGKMTDEGDANTLPTHTNYVRIGNLKGIGGIGVDQWGIAGARNLGTTIGSGFEGFVLEESTGLRLYNSELRLYTADVLTTRLHTDGIEMYNSSGAINAFTVYTGTGSLASGGKTLNNGDVLIGDSLYGAGGYIWFDRSTGNLEIKGSINLIGSIPYGDVSGLGGLATADNLDDVPNGSTYVRTTPNQRDGGQRAYNAINSSNRVVGLVKPTVGAGATPGAGAGLYLGSDYMGYYNGSNWRTYMQSNGNFYLAGTGAHGLTWASNQLNIVGAITIQSGTGIANLSDAGNLATKNSVNLNSGEVTNKSLANLDSTANSKLSGIEANATVGADWGSNLSGRPSYLTDGRISAGINANGDVIRRVLPGTNVGTPGGSGLYLGADKMGYYNGTKWKTYMQNNGNFYFAGAGSGAIAWDGTYLYGTNGSTVQWEASSADGKMRAGGGQVIMDVNGITLPHVPGAYIEAASLTFKTGSTVVSEIYSGTDAFGTNTDLYIKGPGSTEIRLNDHLTLGERILVSSDLLAPSVEATALYARYSSAYGYVRVQAQTSGSNTGWVGWYNGSGTRLGYMGSDPSNMKLQLENGAIFDVNGNMDVSGTATVGSFGTWTNLSLASGWTNFNTSTHSRASYIKIGNLVYLRGIIYRSASQTTVLTLPSGARPGKEHVFGQMAYTGIRRVGIAASGVVTCYNEGSGDPNTYLSLDGIVFSTS